MHFFSLKCIHTQIKHEMIKKQQQQKNRKPFILELEDRSDLMFGTHTLSKQRVQ